MPAPPRPAMPWDTGGPLGERNTFVLGPAAGRQSMEEARAAGLLVVDLSDEWAPFIFSESDGRGGEVKPNAYRQAFVGLANDRASPDEIFMASPEGVYAVLTSAGLAGDKASAESAQGRRVLAEARRALRTQREPNFLEAYGIPPTLSVLLARIEEDARRDCYAGIDYEGLTDFDGTVTYQSREQARQEYQEALGDAAWLEKELARATEVGAGTEMTATATPASAGAGEQVRLPAASSGNGARRAGASRPAGAGADRPTGVGGEPADSTGVGGKPAAPTGVGGRPAGPTGVGGEPAAPTGVGGKPADSTGVGGRPADFTGVGGKPADFTGVGGEPAATGAGDSIRPAGAGAGAAVQPDGPGAQLTREERVKRIAAEDPRAAARIDRYYRGQARLRAVRAAQVRLVCEGLLHPRARLLPGLFDLATNEALALFERKNDIFGWGFLGGETAAALQRPPLELHFATFRRLLMERLADAAGIIEDGSVGGGKKLATWTDADGTRHPVLDLLAEYTDALMAAMKIENAADMVHVLRKLGREGLGRLHVAFAAPPLPPYYADHMDLSVEIDRGDVWYDFPFDAQGRPLRQERVRFPSLTLFVTWAKQKIPLCRWRTTIGSWRSELHPNGKVYFKYKNSDVGARAWRDVVAAPVWIPPEGTPAKDLLTRKTFNRSIGPIPVVDTDVMGPGFQSAYGLVMAIHHWKRGRGFFDNQIRTHGSVDYTSIARRFSHGCHRLVNTRAVRLFDFILRHRELKRIGNVPLTLRRRFTHEDKEYRFALGTRGYYYELTPPIPVLVTEGRIRGKVRKPVEAYLPKPGVDYGGEEVDGVATSTP